MAVGARVCLGVRVRVRVRVRVSVRERVAEDVGVRMRLRVRVAVGVLVCVCVCARVGACHDQLQTRLLAVGKRLWGPSGGYKQLKSRWNPQGKRLGSRTGRHIQRGPFKHRPGSQSWLL